MATPTAFNVCSFNCLAQLFSPKMLKLNSGGPSESELSEAQSVTIQLRGLHLRNSPQENTPQHTQYNEDTKMVSEAQTMCEWSESSWIHRWCY